jgi:hypothetical protein
LGATSRDGALRELQRAFAHELTALDHFTHTLPPNLSAAIAGDVSFATDRFNRYKRFHRTRLFGFLLSTYEAVVKILPKRAAERLLHAFLSQERSRSYSMLDYLTRFLRFVSRNEVARKYPYLPDLARLEHDLAFVFSAAPHPPCVTRQSGVRLNSHVVLLRSAWHVSLLWSERETLKVRAGGHQKFRLERPAFVALVKLPFGVRVIRLDDSLVNAIRRERFSEDQLAYLSRINVTIRD